MVDGVGVQQLIEGGVLVERPARARVLTELGLRGSANEIPDPLEQWESPKMRDAKPDGWWLAEGAFFEGSAWPINRYGELSAAVATSATTCTAAFCVAHGRLLTIISPNNSAEPAIWMNIACSRIRVNTESDGSVALDGDGWQMKAIRISRLFRHVVQKGLRPAEISEKYQTGQGRSFIEAIAEGARTTPGYTVVDPTSDAPPAGAGYEWVQEPRLGGLYRLIRMGKLTSVTSLVDRELSEQQQIEALRSLDWVPSFILDYLVESTREHALPKLTRPALPNGRVTTPFTRIYLSTWLAEGPPARHPVVSCLWPSASAAGLNLEPGEEIITEWTAPYVILYHYASPDDRLFGSEFDRSSEQNVRVYVTSRRVVVIADRDPAKIQSGDARRWWAVHFRHEWISELGMIENTVVKKAGFRQKVVGSELHETPYVRLVLPTGSINEMSFHATKSSTPGGAEFIDHLAQALGPRASDSDSKANAAEVPFGTRGRRFRGVSDAIPYSLPEALV